MKKAIKPFLIFILLLFYSGNSLSPSKGRGVIEVVFCLDLSGSTNGLLDDIREKLWDIVNQVNSYRPAPEFRIGIIGFSRPSFGSQTSYVKVLQPLTTDFDLLNFELYKLKPTVEKGDQIVGEAIKMSVRNMSWSGDNDALKVVYLVGNGIVNAGGNNYREACELAVRKNIIVNTLYCRTMNNVDRELPGWREIARLTGGEQYDIRIHKRTPLILTSPNTIVCREIADRLSSTYLYYGKDGFSRYKMMAAIDKNALLANEMTFESRLFYKISDRYQFHQQYWDLVDYLKMSNSDFSNIDMTLLHDSLKFKSPADVREMAFRLKDERNKIITELRKHLPYDRQAIINKKLEENDVDKSDMFDRVVINSLNSLSAANGFSTGNPASIDFRR